MTSSSQRLSGQQPGPVTRLGWTSCWSWSRAAGTCLTLSSSTGSGPRSLSLLSLSLPLLVRQGLHLRLQLGPVLGQPLTLRPLLRYPGAQLSQLLPPALQCGLRLRVRISTANSGLVTSRLLLPRLLLLLLLGDFTLLRCC